jgi:site-specific DNA-adenine methylase
VVPSAVFYNLRSLYKGSHNRKRLITLSFLAAVKTFSSTLKNMNQTMNQRKQTTERSKMREKEALKRCIALLEEENGILKQAVEIAERANNAQVIYTHAERQSSRLR